MADFFSTLMGKKLIQGDIPRIARSLEKIARALDKSQNQPVAKSDTISHGKFQIELSKKGGIKILEEGGQVVWEARDNDEEAEEGVTPSCQHGSFRPGHSPFVPCVCNDCGEEMDYPLD